MDILRRLLFLFYLIVSCKGRSPYPCQIDGVIKCGQTAIDDAIKYSCDWTKVIPKFETCVDYATRGCYGQIQTDHDTWVAQLNKTIHMMVDGTSQTTNGCVRECLNDHRKKQDVDVCATTGNGLTKLSQLILASKGTTQNMNNECMEIANIETCMMKQVGSCKDILTYINLKLTAAKWVEVKTLCATQYVWPDSTQADKSKQRTETDRGFDVEYVIIIVIAVVLLVIVNIIVCFVIYRERRKKENAKLRGSTTDNHSSDPLPPYSTPSGSPYPGPGAYTGLYPNLPSSYNSSFMQGINGSRPPSYGAGGYGEAPTKPY